MSNEKLLRREADPDMSVVGPKTEVAPLERHVRSTPDERTSPTKPAMSVSCQKRKWR
jgi:hypothetical protein